VATALQRSAVHRRLAVRIRALAEARDMSLNKLSDFAGISRSQLGRVLRCDQSPTLSLLERIAKALDVTARELLD
jgi:transcriptional regulator with XRE-family HTH domain